MRIGRWMLRTTFLVFSLILLGTTANAVANGYYGKVMVSWKDAAGEKHSLFLRLRYSIYGWSTEGHYQNSRPFVSELQIDAVTKVSKVKWHTSGGMNSGTSQFIVTIEVFPPINGQPAYVTMELFDGTSTENLGPIVPGPDDIFWVDWASLP